VSEAADDLTSLLADLEALMLGRLSAAEFRARHQTNGGSTPIDVISENLEHYLSDGERRARDPAHRRMQNEELGKLIRLLETGASAERLRNITFLTFSGD
jgi:hypothetical protein